MRDFSSVDSDARIADQSAQRAADIRRGIQGRISVFQKITCDLATAQLAQNARKLSIPFRSIFVRSATDSTAVVYLSPNDNAIGSIAESIPLYKNDSFDFGITMSAAYLWWDAQAGKTMDLFLSTEGRMQPGSQLSQISGGLSVSAGSVLASNKLAGAVATIACPAATATPILSADADRKVMVLYIDGAAWIGDASVSPGARGVLYPAGLVTIDSTAAHYLYPVGGVVNVFGNDYR